MRAGIGVVCGLAALVACADDEGATLASRTNADGAPAVAAAPPGGDARAEAPGRVLFVGTSLTAGYGLDPARAYPALIARKIDEAGLPFEVVNAGVSGETSAGAARRIPWLLRQPVDVLVLETGANDGLRAIEVSEVRRNIQRAIDEIRARQPGARIVLVQMEAPPNLGEQYTGRFRSVYRELAERNGVDLVPFLLEGVAGEPSLNQEDGIHPNVPGAERVAENVWRALRPILEAEAASLDRAGGAD